jgi:hypothetical protein
MISSTINSLRGLVGKAVILGSGFGILALMSGCGSKEPSVESKIEAKKEADAQLERAAELYRKKQQAGQNR